MRTCFLFYFHQPEDILNSVEEARLSTDLKMKSLHELWSQTEQVIHFRNIINYSRDNDCQRILI